MSVLDWFTIIAIVGIASSLAIAMRKPPTYVRTRDGTIVPSGDVQTEVPSPPSPTPPRYDWPCDELGKSRTPAPEQPKHT